MWRVVDYTSFNLILLSTGTLIIINMQTVEPYK